MIAVRLTGDLEMKVVAAPSYLARHEPIERPQDLYDNRCLTYRRPNDGSVYRWEFEKDGASLEIDVSEPIVVDEPAMLTDVVLAGPVYPISLRVRSTGICQQVNWCSF